MFLKLKRTRRTGGRVLSDSGAFGAVGFTLRNLSGRGWAGMVSRKASGVRARIWSPGHGVPFGNYVCAFRGAGGRGQDLIWDILCQHGLQESSMCCRQE